VNDERARQGIEHLQAAAFEVISAVRAFLDVAEDLVRDPSTAAGLATSLMDVAATAASVVAHAAAPQPASSSANPGAPAHRPEPSDAPEPPDGQAESGDSRVTRIRVS